MKEQHAKRIKVERELREQVKHEQNCHCGFCQREYPTHDLYIHHIIPVAHHEPGEGDKANRRENLCALCSQCHSLADHYALEKHIYLPDLIEMKERMEYILNPQN